MLKKLILAAAVVYGVNLKAQNNFLMPDSSSQVVINGIGGVASSGIPQSFMNKFIFPEFIDNDLKDEASSSLSDNNLFGGVARGNINLMLSAVNDTAKTSNLFGIGFGTNTEGNLNFTKDLFNVIFYGNQPYAGQSLNLDQTYFNALSYSYLEVSLGKSKVTPNAHTSVWADFGAVIGHGFTEFKVEKASLFTEDLGDYVSLNIEESNLSMSDTISTGISQGYGAKLDLHYSSQTSNSKLLISAENLGGIFWTNASSANVDTSFTFEGVEVGNIFELSDSVWNQIGSVDSVVNSTKGDVFKALPIDLSLYYKRDLTLLYFDIYARYRLLTNYRPFVRAGANLNLPIFKPGITAAYGGYGALQVGLNTDIKLVGDLMLIQLGTNNVLGAIIPGSVSALDFYAGLRYQF